MLEECLKIVLRSKRIEMTDRVMPTTLTILRVLVAISYSLLLVCTVATVSRSTG